jgi:hypothetical protein
MSAGRLGLTGLVASTVSLGFGLAIAGCASEPTVSAPSRAESDLPVVGRFTGYFDGNQFFLASEPMVLGDDRVGVATAPLTTLDAGASGSGVTASGTDYVALEQLAGSRAGVANGVTNGAAWDPTRCGPLPTTGTCVQIQMRNLFPNHQLNRAHVFLTRLEPTGQTTTVTARPPSIVGVETAQRDATMIPDAPALYGLWRYGTVERSTPPGFPPPHNPGRPDIAWAFTGTTRVGSPFSFTFTFEVRAEMVYPIERADVASGTSDRPPAYGAGTGGNADASGATALSGDGAYMVFTSAASNLIPGTITSVRRVYRRHMDTGGVELVSTSTGITIPEGCDSFNAAATTDTDLIVFQSDCNLDPADSFGAGDYDIYLRKMSTGELFLLSRAGVSGPIGDGPSIDPSISSEGYHVAFESQATNLVPGRPVGRTSWDVYRVIVATRAIHLASRTAGVGDLAWPNGDSRNAAIRASSSTGALVYFESTATDLVLDDTNGVQDIFQTTIGGTGSVLARARLSMSAAFTELDGPSHDVFVAGSALMYVSSASGVTSTDPAPGGIDHVYYRSRTASASGAATTRRISQRGTTLGNGDSGGPRITANGRWITFHSQSTNLTDNPTSGRQAFGFDRLARAPLVDRPFVASAIENWEIPAGDVEDAPVGVSEDGLHMSFVSAQGLVAATGGHAYYTSIPDVIWQ